jgi:hypothetical protein
MRRSFLKAVLALLAQPGLPAALAADASAPRPAGRVALVEGEVRFLDRAGTERRPKVGDLLYEGDSVVTGPDGEVQLAMEDAGYTGVRPGSELQVETFKAEGGPDDVSVVALLKGSLRSVTGWIPALGGGAGGTGATVRTPTATIGARGTDYEPLVVPEGAKEGEPGTYDRVYAGETVIETPQGSVAVKTGQAGFAPLAGGAAPRLLERVPEFFRPTRNEGRFDGLHERIREQIQKRREERRHFKDRGDRAERPERPERAERVERVERIDRPERSGK